MPQWKLNFDISCRLKVIAKQGTCHVQAELFTLNIRYDYFPLTATVVLTIYGKNIKKHNTNRSD